MRSNPKEEPRFKDESGHECRLIVCGVSPGDRKVTVRKLRDRPFGHVGAWYLESLEAEKERVQDLLRVPLPIHKAEIYKLCAQFKLPPHVMHHLAKDLRRASVRVAEKTWEQVLPKDIVAWASRELAEHSRDEMFVDNDRVARVGISSQMRRFHRQEAAGCCGSATFERVGPDGHRYLLGYNYGH